MQELVSVRSSNVVPVISMKKIMKAGAFISEQLGRGATLLADAEASRTCSRTNMAIREDSDNSEITRSEEIGAGN